MNEPLVWEEVPSKGLDGATVLRAMIDGRGWLVVVVNDSGEISSPMYLPDINNMWGK